MGPSFCTLPLDTPARLGVAGVKKFIENRHRSIEENGEGGADDVTPSPIPGFPVFPTLGAWSGCSIRCMEL